MSAANLIVVINSMELIFALKLWMILNAMLKNLQEIKKFMFRANTHN
jgi:hypothetical protein